MTHNILVLGSGAREHAIIDNIRTTPIIKNIYVYPGNCAMSGGKVHIIEPSNKLSTDELHQYIVTFCKSNDIEMVIVGHEKYLVNGICNILKEHNIKCFGPSKEASQIEGSKIFSKNFMQKHNIPTAKFIVSKGSLTPDVLSFIESRTNTIPEYVIKLDELASGKGVFIPSTIDDALKIMSLFIKKDIIIEDKLLGEEVSIMGFCNGNDIVLMPQSQDHKRIYDNDLGPNTGGMGAYAPASVLDSYELEEVRQHMLKVVKELNYIGVLYAGIMKCDSNIYFLEFNCRFGDPEAQVLLNLLDSDLYTIMHDCIDGKQLDVKWKTGFCANVVLSHQLYPIKNSHELVPIKFDKKYFTSFKLYWDNVMDYDNDLYTNGGRVASLVYYSQYSLRDAFEHIYNNIYHIQYPGIYFRRDIGIKNLTKCKPLNKHIRIGILGSTKGTSLQPLIDAINNNNNNNLLNNNRVNATISVVISNKKNAYILDRARDNGISSIYLPFKSNTNKNDYDRHIVNLLRLYQVDVVYLIGYNRIITPILIDEYRGKILNIHPSLLPTGKGLWDQDVHQYILDNKFEFTGCTLHHVTENIDGGNIMLQRQFRINNNTTSNNLKEQVQKLEGQIIIDSVNILSNEGWNYKTSGVDVDKGNLLVKSIKGISEDMNKHIGGFCAFYEHGDKTYGATTDGVGTKLDLAIKLNSLDTIGIDLVAMSINDLLVCGVKPLFFLDYIAVDKINVEQCETIIKGIHKGCIQANCQLIGGETAEMKGLYLKDKLDLVGFAVGEVIEKLPRPIKDGDYIYGIKSSGIHSNGYTLVNKLLTNKSFQCDIDIKDFLIPTIIYSEIIDIMKHYGHKLRGMAHITGGGIIDNLPRILPDDLTFQINTWTFPKIFQWIQQQTNMSNTEMLQTFNCGYGIILVFNEELKNSHLDNMDYLGRIINK